MKKKWLLGIFGILFTAFCGIGLSACSAKNSHDHHYDDIITPPTCTSQGYTLHLCRCGDAKVDTYVKPSGHNYTQFISNGDATCTEDGTETAVCMRCSFVETRTAVDSKLGHTHSLFISTHTPETCETNRIETYQCIRCDSTENKEIANTAYNHDYSIFVETYAQATCTTNTIDILKCKYCESKGLVPRANTALNHLHTKYTGVHTPASCENNRIDNYQCIRCEDIIQEEVPYTALDHTYNQLIGVQTPATCTTNRFDTYKCARCDDSTVVEISNSSLGHSYTNYIFDQNATCTANGTETAVCGNGCSLSHTRPATGTAKGHDFIINLGVYSEETCISNRIDIYQCSRCSTQNFIEAENTAKGHNYTTCLGIYSEATCGANRVDLYECDRCHTTVRNEIENTALSHNYSENLGTETLATCTSNRFDLYKCTTCKSTQSKEIANTMLPHTCTTLVGVYEEETCLSNRFDAYQCINCPAIEPKEVPNTRTEHDFSVLISEILAPTCTQDGKYLYQCSTCTVKKELTDEGSAFGHSYTKYIGVHSEASYAANRFDSYQCERCTDTQAKEIPDTMLASSIEFLTLTVNNTDVTGTFRNAITSFNFTQEIRIVGIYTYTLSSDQAESLPITNKNVSLYQGTNVIYVNIYRESEKVEQYKVTLYRNHKYTVSFSDGIASQQVEEGYLAEHPGAPAQKEHYVFDGWDFDFNTPITQNISINAKWSLETHTVSIQSSHEKAGTITGAGEHEYGKTVTVTASAANSRYVFVGWAIGTTPISSQTSYTFTIEEDITLQALWNYFPSADNSYVSLNDCEEVGEYKFMTYSATNSLSMAYATNGTYSVKVTTSYGGIIVPYFLIDGAPATRDDIAEYDYLYLDIYAETSVNLFGYNTSLATLNIGWNNVKIPTSKIVAEIDKYKDNVPPQLDNEGGFYLAVYTSATLYFDHIALINDSYNKTYYSVTVEQSDPEAGFVSGAGNYVYSQYATLQAYTYEGYVFKGWYVNNSRVSSSTTYSYYVYDNHTITAKWDTVSQTVVAGSSMDNAITITSGSSYTVTIDDPGETIYYSFTPTSSKNYTIESTGSLDTKGTLYSSSRTELAHDDDGADTGRNFSITYSLTKNTTYYIAVKLYSSDSTGTFTLVIS